MKFVVSSHGHPQLLYDNHIFNRNNATENCIYWRCAHARRLKCKARIVSSKDQIIPTNGIHNHEPMRRLIYGMGENKVRKLSKKNYPKQLIDKQI